MRRLSSVTAPEGEPTVATEDRVPVGSQHGKSEAGIVEGSVHGDVAVKKGETETAEGSVQADVAVEEGEAGTTDGEGQDDMVGDEWPDVGPFWSLLARAGYRPW